MSRLTPTLRSQQPIMHNGLAQSQRARLRHLALIGLLAFIMLAAAAVEAAPNTLTIGIGNSPAFVLNRSRLPILVYSNDSLVLATCSDLACPVVSTTTIPGTRFSAQPSIALTATGQPVISYYNTSARDLVLAVCASASCTSATITVVDSSGDVGQYSSIQLTSSGKPVISYYDASSGDLKLAICSNPLCTVKTLQRVDHSRNVGQFTSLRLISDRAVISYYDVSGANLMLAVCNNATCTRPDITTVDSSGSVGQYTSLEMNSSGDAVISYYDATNGNLKLAACDNSNCTRATIRVVDSAGNVGQFTSLALNENNRPAISYYSVSSRTMRIAVCQDRSCANSQRVDIGAASAASTAINLRSPRGVYAAFVNRDGRVTLYADIPTPTGCYIDAPSSINEGATLNVTVRCDGLTVPVYGFEIGLRARGRVITTTPVYTSGTFVTSAGVNVLQVVNRIDSYAVSRRNPATSITGSFSLGSIDFTVPQVRRESRITLTLNKLLLGNVQGARLHVPITRSTEITVMNMD